MERKNPFWLPSVRDIVLYSLLLEPGTKDSDLDQAKKTLQYSGLFVVVQVQIALGWAARKMGATITF
jgi:hypothetical protein